MKRFWLFLSLLAALTSGTFGKAQYSTFTQSFLADFRAAQDTQRKTGSSLTFTEAARSQYLVKSTPAGEVVHGMLQVVEANRNQGHIHRRDSGRRIKQLGAGENRRL